MPPADDKNRIDELNKSLYSRTSPDVRTHRKLRFKEVKEDVKTSWERPTDDAPEPTLNTAYEDHSMSFLTKLLIGSAIFCVLAIGLGTFLFLNGSNLISADNIDITISGPVSIPGGEPVSFDVKVVNKNNIALQLTDLSVDFPAGTTDPANPSRTLKNYRDLIGDIPAGGSAEKTVKAIIFGEENLQKQILVSVTYSVKGSTAVFTKTRTYDVLINSSPINLSVTSFKEITSGQEFEIKALVKSNSQQTLKGVLLKATYPFGYTFVSSNPKPLSNNASWRIGDIPPGGQRTITIRGKLQGEDTDTRIFHFIVGAESANDPKNIGTEYMAVEQDITLEKPFISLTATVEGDSGATPHPATFGQSYRVEIQWFNNLPTTVSNMEIVAHISGTAYDKASIQPDIGYFRSTTDDMVWNQQTNPELASVGPGASGVLSFIVIPRDTSSPSRQVVNPSVAVTVGVSGNRTQESNVPQALSSTITRTLVVSSNISLSGRIVRTVGPFTNTGPVPPRVDAETSYTIIWTVDSTANSVSNAQVIATLPPYVKWLGNVSPTNEIVSYDKNAGTIIWNVGSVGTYTVNSARRREVAFQISFVPSVNQADQSPPLVNQTTLTAIDDFTGVQLKSLQENLTTRFSTDPTYKDGQAAVVK